MVVHKMDLSQKKQVANQPDGKVMRQSHCEGWAQLRLVLME